VGHNKNLPKLLAAITTLVSGASGLLRAQDRPLEAPVVTATVKGPSQINLTWPAVSNAGYGYLVEIQSAGESRYSAWTELQPIPTASGYSCNGTIIHNGGSCNISDPSGAHVYNSSTRGIPYWVSDHNYIDPQDVSAAQFIAWGLKPNTSYSFRVRSYSGDTAPIYSTYSAVATAVTANYALRFVSPEGNDSNNGTGPDKSRAWRTLSRGASAIQCGQALIVLGGTYANDGINMPQKCSAQAKAVVLVNPGDRAVITSVPPGAEHVLQVDGSHIVIDGLISESSSNQNGEYDGVVRGSYNALLNVDFHPPVVPAFKGGLMLSGDHNLLYRSNLHDYGSPDATQNPNGNGGFVLTVMGSSAIQNVIWSNHLTRGGHDVSLCKSGCNYNRWLNNAMDGGWGMGWEAIDNSKHNLVEGNFIKDVGHLVTFYKPAIEISDSHNTVRRNVVVNGRRASLEVSALQGGSSVAESRIYNNVFYSPGECYFQSHNSGVAAYDNVLYANNICYKIQNYATDIYLDNQSNKITHNTMLFADVKGSLQPNHEIIIWNHDANGSFQYPKTLAYADKTYRPVFSSNKGLDVNPRFVNEANFDFHLAANSPLIGAGTEVADPEWGSASGAVDLGAFGIDATGRASPTVPGRPSPKRGKQ
jgi:hypothetical protein